MFRIEKKIFWKTQKRMDNFSDTTENEIDENDAEIQKLLKYKLKQFFC